MGGARALDAPVVDGSRKARSWGMWVVRSRLTELDDGSVSLGSYSLSFALPQPSRASTTGYKNEVAVPTA